MAIAIDRDTFEPEDYERFSAVLTAQLDQLGQVLATPGFGEGPTTIGAELEMPLVGENGDARPVNVDVLSRLRDARATVEIARFNVECNLTPVLAAGSPFSAIATEMDELLAAIRTAGAEFDAHPMPVGILPSLTRADVGAGSLTAKPRYFALERAIMSQRSGPAVINIDGEEPLKTTHDSVTFEGANTSFQLHLRVSAAQYADTYNAAQILTPVAVAIAANSPIFLDHLLWDETRIALFKQSMEHRSAEELAWHRPSRVSFGSGWVRPGALELFAESVRMHPPIFPLCSAIADDGDPPHLPELRLHQGTVWRWNRAVYDPDAGGHLRIEFRALPSGPTSLDMLANAAFLIGATVGLRDEIEHILQGCPFLMADRSFYRAARDGIDAELLWPSWLGLSPRERSIRDLVRVLLPVADRGLESLGVDSAERSKYLGVISDRVDSGQTGARWQRRALEQLRAKTTRADAPRRLVRGYAERAASGSPVHTWPAI
jgi:gamma-glutamyl:cysteine ligase YbdK (ATP-grasp superfamily)